MAASPRGRPGLSPPWLMWLLILVLFVWASVYWRPPTRTEVPTWTDFEAIARKGGFVDGSVVLHNDEIEAVLKPKFTYEGVKSEKGEKRRAYVAIDRENRGFYLGRLADIGVGWRDQTGSSVWLPVLIAWGPLLLLFLLIGFMIFRARQATQAGPAGIMGRFAQSRHRVASKETVNVTLDDVAGIEEAKAEVQELIEFLSHPEKFQTVGARIPKGVLLCGPPGCGKTLLARAIAGEADVPFFSVSGSDFMEMFVGVGASRVRDLFQKAKQQAPCIIFLDEIDAIGRRRGTDFMAGGGHGEREQTLNAVLSEMDGFEPHDQVIAIAATNRPDVLDPALTRRGRFDRQVFVPLPDVVGRKAILEIHAKKARLGEDVNLEQLARTTPLLSGADLAALINEAAIIAALRGSGSVTMEDLQEARDKIRFGRSQTGREIERGQRIAAAYHEAGHALVQYLLDDADPVEKITIIPRGRAMGATLALPEKDRYSYGRKYMEAMLRALCAGRIAEARKTSDVSSGAQDDIDKATSLAKKMILEWGMSERLGFVKYADENRQERWLLEKEWSEATAGQIDDEIRRLVGEAYGDAERLIDENWDSVVSVAEALLERETLTADDLKRLVHNEPAENATDEKTEAPQGTEAAC